MGGLCGASGRRLGTTMKRYKSGRGGGMGAVMDPRCPCRNGIVHGNVSALTVCRVLEGEQLGLELVLGARHLVLPHIVAHLGHLRHDDVRKILAADPGGRGGRKLLNQL